MQLQNIETKINETIKDNLKVLKTFIPVKSANQLPAYKLSVIKVSIF